MRNYKRLPFKNLYNCRDLGGYECKDNGYFDFHKLYRSDNPANLTDDEWKLIDKMNVKTIIDLRSLDEQKDIAYTTPSGIEKISFPLQKNMKIKFSQMLDITDMATVGFGNSVIDGYNNTVEKGPELCAEVLNIIGDRLNKGALMYHCTAGKDRTGVLTALIYLICGVSSVDIVADYQVTATYNKNNPLFDTIPEVMKPFMNSNPQNMFDFINSFYDKNYMELLYQNGLKKEAVCSIVKNCVI